jgi:hypothetical protein
MTTGLTNRAGRVVLKTVYSVDALTPCADGDPVELKNQGE